MKKHILSVLVLSILMLTEGCVKEVAVPGVCNDKETINSYLAMSDSALYYQADVPEGYSGVGICSIKHYSGTAKKDIMAGGAKVGSGEGVVGAANVIRQALKDCKCGL